MSKPSDATEYIEAKNDLRKKVREIRRRSPADDPVKRAEAALQILSTHFDDWMRDEVKTMFATRDTWVAVDYREGEEKRAFHRAVHDIKGQSTTLGFPLATRVAGSLCSLLERITDRKLIPIDLVNQHVDAIRAIVRERAKDEQNRIGSALTQTLLEVTEAYIARHGHVDEDDDGVIVRDL